MIRKANGFTLIEVLVALMIVAAAIMASASLWSGNFAVMRKSALNYDVATLLERKMVEIEAKYKDKPLTEVPESEEGDFGTDAPNVRWEMKSRDMEFPDLSALMMGQEEKPDEMIISMIKQMTEYLSKVVKEVKVSVFIKRNKREIEFSATQYFVDYTKEFGGAGAGTEGGQQQQQQQEQKPSGG